MFPRMRLIFQCLERLGQKSHVWKDTVRIPIFERKRKRKQFQRLKRKGKNSSVSLDKVRIPMFGRIRPEFHCLEG